MIYVRAAIVVAVALLVGTVFYYRAEMIDANAKRATAEASLAVAVEANASLNKALERAEDRQRRHDALMNDLLDNIEQINDRVSETSTAVAELEKINEDVRAFLALPVPDALGRLLNR